MFEKTDFSGNSAKFDQDYVVECSSMLTEGMASYQADFSALGINITSAVKNLLYPVISIRPCADHQSNDFYQHDP